MQQILPYLVVLVVGAVAGAFIAWLIQRSRITSGAAQAQAESQVELATLRTKLESAEEDRRELSGQIESVRTRLAAAETDLTQTKTQLAERTQVLEGATRRANELGEQLVTERQKVENLNVQIQAEGQRAAGFEQQALSVPKLNEALNAAAQESAALKKELADLREKVGAATTTSEMQVQRISQIELERDELARRRAALEEECSNARAQLAELQTNLDAERRQTAEKLQLLKNAEEQLTNRFKTLANDILEEKTKRFTEQNQTNLTALLDPLRTRIQEFQGKVEEVYVKEGKDRSALAEQIRQLTQLNQQLTSEANNLTRALTSEAKTQGGWGELRLERVLEASGLIEDTHYTAQKRVSQPDAPDAQPDIVLHLPKDKHLVIDAKVSLTAYAEYVGASTDEIREAAVKRHLESVRKHVRELSEKNYQNLYQLKSLDFVMMFIPIEPAFTLAILRDEKLWQEAWDRNVLLVSPSTLLFVVRTVAYLWRQEDQTRNAQEIAKRGAELYDKLSGFVSELKTLGDRLADAQKAYDEATKKLSTGRGNVIRQAEMLKELGVKPTKALPSSMVESATEDTAVAAGTNLSQLNQG